jgi:energy-coupling factor transporter transmembrane protein EcfT
VVAILLQIVHQSATLGDETRRIAAVMALRGASSRGFAAWRMLLSLPQVWLPRIIERAERVAAVMALRGYHAIAPTSFQHPKMRLIDVWLVMLPVGLLILAIMLRLWSVA